MRIVLAVLLALLLPAIAEAQSGRRIPKRPTSADPMPPKESGPPVAQPEEKKSDKPAGNLVLDDDGRTVSAQNPAGLGFTLTLATIHLMPYWVDALGWRYAFVPLSIGPALGVWAMARLRAHPMAVRLAGGRR